MATMLRSFVAIPILLLAGACCDDDCDAPVYPPEVHRVSILVEVYDPVTNLVWENVTVRVAEAYQEWSGCLCVSPFTDGWLTDANGLVLLDDYALADAGVGFLEDDLGRAVLGPYAYEDEATVLVEVSAVGFVTVFVDVPLRWDQPDVFVSIPFQ